MPIRTKLTELLGIEAPIIQGGMQYVGYAEMASAVSNAGGLGILTALSQSTPDALRAEIRRCRSMTKKPFGVNLTILKMLIPADYDAYARVIAEEHVAMVEVAGGSPKKYIPMWHEAGVVVLHKSATMRHALKAQEAGVDIIEIVGYGASIAGGQPGDEVSAWVMLAKACMTLKVPVVASGASATGRQLAAALAMGAQGITMATRFLATVEAPIHPKIKTHMAREDVDERSTVVVLGELQNATRVFRNDVSETINAITSDSGDSISFDQLAPYASGVRTKRMWQETGDFNDAMWSCGQSVGLIDDVPTCADLIRRIVSEAESQIKEQMDADGGASNRGSIVGVKAYEEDQKKKDPSLPIGIGASSNCSETSEVDSTSDFPNESMEDEEISSSAGHRGSMINGAATEKEIEEEAKKMGIVQNRFEEDDESSPSGTTKYRGSIINSATPEDLERERNNMEKKKKEFSECDDDDDDDDDAHRDNEKDSIFPVGNKRGSMISGATTTELEAERRKLNIIQQKDEETKTTVEYTPSQHRGSMINGASEAELAAERKRLDERNDDGNVKHLTIGENKGARQEDSESSKVVEHADDGSGSAGEEDPDPSSEIPPNRFRGSIINGGTEEELEAERKKLQDFLAQAKNDSSEESSEEEASEAAEAKAPEETSLKAGDKGVPSTSSKFCIIS
eukprot:g2196.t1